MRLDWKIYYAYYGYIPPYFAHDACEESDTQSSPSVMFESTEENDGIAMSVKSSRTLEGSGKARLGERSWRGQFGFA